MRAGFGELRTVGTETATDLEHREIFCVGEAGGNGNVPLFRVAMFFDELVEPARTWLGVGKLGPAGMFLPKRTHTLFELGVCFRHREGERSITVARVSDKRDGLLRSPVLQDPG